ncbi:MAG: hypothetical protein JOZ52_04465, partial [Acidobacteria bacterium]|nr:hypothetical protein [Acidobacteriota bacterium]
MKTLYGSQTQRWRVWPALFVAYVLLVTTAFGQTAAPQTTATLSAAEREASARVKVETLREVTTALADKAMEGRGTGQAGGERAAKYIADRFAKLGLKPLGDAGGYLQAVGFKTTQLAPASSVKIGDASLKLIEDFVPSPPFTADKLSASADVIFAGYGVTSEALKRDDLAGLDVKGKIVMVIIGQPKNADAALWQQQASRQAVGNNLIRRGVAGIIVAHVGSPRASYEQVADYFSRRDVVLASAPEMPFQLPPIVLVSDAAANKIFAGTGMTYAETLAKAETGESV